MNTNVKMIPLSSLTAWEGNVRKTGSDAGIKELAESIASHGLLQSLVVASLPVNGKAEVIAGRRRFLALMSLAEDGRIERDMLVPCSVAGGELDPTELSLAENIVRAPMHPSDQCEAFRALIDGGASIAEVAARFSISEAVVNQRLKLGRLSQKVLIAYREGEIDLEQAQAFAVTDDVEAQERVLAALPHMHGSPTSIRRALTAGEVAADDRRVVFVGLEAYQAAGGAVRRDLFEEFGDYVTDSGLLDRLVIEKLGLIRETVMAEGWSWTEIMPARDFSALSQFSRRYPEQAELTDELAAELETLETESDALAGSDDPEADQRCSEIADRIEAIEAAAEYWPQEILAKAGAVVSIGYDGSAEIERGLIRPGEDEETPPPSRGKRDPQALPDSLVTSLSAQKTAALQVALADRPDVALAAVVHALGAKAFYGHVADNGCLQLIARESKTRSAIGMDVRSLDLRQEATAKWQALLPDREDELWDWCLSQDQDVLLRLLAYLAAGTVNATQIKGERGDCPRIEHANALSHTLGLDLSEWFTPDAENFFKRINSSQIIATICEAKGVPPAPSWAKMKKAELCALAEKQVQGTGWLPALLRHGS